MKTNVEDFHVDIVSVIYRFIIILPYTQSIHIKLKKKKMRQGSTRKPIRLVYLINNYNIDIGNLTLSTHNFGT